MLQLDYAPEFSSVVVRMLYGRIASAAKRVHTVPALLSSSQRSFPKCRFCFDVPDPQRTCSEEAAHFRPAAVSASLRVPEFQTVN